MGLVIHQLQERWSFPSYILRRLETPDQYWREFQDNHIKLVEYEDQDYAYFSENHFEKAKSHYTNCQRIFQQHLSIDQEKKSVLRPATPLASVTSDWRPPSVTATTAATVAP
ncbi:unnamed protein product [Parnassius apollo]|uniref:(apollo) hypothetical protein n=1 Tax=Parnassius apollo TaxID=110799 RepID=A0A8S3X320_PARAO|nr:unnamed protein product [Parnassius apollo]